VHARIAVQAMRSATRATRTPSGQAMASSVPLLARALSPWSARILHDLSDIHATPLETQDPW